MKNALRLLLAMLFCVILCVGFTQAAHAETGSGTWGNLSWTLDDIGTLTISGSGAMNDFQNSDSSAWHAYAYMSNIRSVVVDENITSIGAYAFNYCTALTSVSMPGVQSIGLRAFSECSALQAVSLPSTLTTISSGAFWGCGLTSLTIPDQVTLIDDIAFEKCEALDSVVLPESISRIGDDAFRNCDKISSVTYKGTLAQWQAVRIGYNNQSLTSIVTCKDGGKLNSLTWTLNSEGTLTISGSGTMNDFTNADSSAWRAYKNEIKTVVIENGVTSIGEYAFCECTKITDISIPNSVTEIGYDAFDLCKSLSSITIPEGVTSIKEPTFSECSSLKNINLPSSLKSISNLSFGGCSHLERINVSIDNQFYSDTDGVLLNKEGTSLLIFPRGRTDTYEIPNGIETIAQSAFQGCGALESISIPKSVVYIGKWAFSSCYLSDIYYKGTQKQWDKVVIAENNGGLISATVHFAKYSIEVNDTVNGSVVAVVNSEHVEDGVPGDTITLTVTPDTGYVLDTLTVKQGETDITVTNNTFTMPAGDVTVTATFKKQSFTITWKNDDGSVIDTTTVEYGETPTHADAEKAATAEYTYTFTGWTPEIAAVTGEARYTATFSASRNTHTISYDANGGTNAPAAQEKPVGSDLVLSSDAPEREETDESIRVTFNANGGSVNPTRRTATRYYSYSFDSWNTMADGSGTSYAPGAAFTADEDTVLYARWNIATENEPVELPTPTREGYTFLGWAESADAAEGITGSYMPEKAITLYAVWEVNTYTVSFDANGGADAPEAQTKTYGTALTLPEAQPTRSSVSAGSFTVKLNPNYGGQMAFSLSAPRTSEYSFLSWNTAADGSGTGYAPGADFEIEADTTLFAQWEGVVTTETVMLPTPERSGCVFLGWSTDTQAASGITGSYTPVTSVTLYALWAEPDLILPASLTTIEDEAFEGGAFTYVQLPEGCSSVGWHAFADCPKLRYIYIPDGCAIDPEAFSGVSGLTILGESGGSVQTWAGEHGYTFIPAA